MNSNLKTSPGNPLILGATLDEKGCNFAIFSKHATKVELFLYNDYKDKTPSYIIPFDKRINKTGDIWHIYIYGIKHGQYYGYVIDGPYEPLKGHRFNKNKLLIDPYAKAISGQYHWEKSNAYGYDRNSPLKDLSFSYENNYDTEVKSIVINPHDFDWEGDKQLNIPLNETIIYEMHVRGFTYHHSSNVKYPGTYLGVIEKIPYLKELGITTIELLPVHEFNELENTRINPLTGEKLKNFTGYSTLAFFAPDSWYATQKDGITAVKEFKTMVKELHKAGIEVILDVVYNHTGEGDETGPTLSFRGIDNSIYYILDNGRFYKNYSGCGNTLNCNHPVVKRLILDSLRYWVVDMHVDGFRFDLAAILGRDKDGKWMPDYSILAEISQDPILSNTKIIAESWDAAGLYKVGGFPERWAEWNGKYRDDVRSFIKGDNGKVLDFTKRISGSKDLFLIHGKTPYHSINFITSHDGFTLNDLVSYNYKHNENNGEDNKDGDDVNYSWNCGVEGDTNDPNILALRNRQMKNFIAILMLSRGTPMVFHGDEMKFSKKGNNNTYCHDNELNWINWNLIKTNRSFFEFFKYMIRFRKKYKIITREDIYNGNNNHDDFIWHGVELYKPDFSEFSHSIAFMLNDKNGKTNNLYVAINAYWEDLKFQLPPNSYNKNWFLCVNTLEEPGFFRENNEILINSDYYIVGARSLIILIEK